MLMTVAPAVMTTEEMLALPRNNVKRWLIEGRLREKPMTVRNRFHSRVMARVSFLLEGWLEQQPQPRGAVLCGEAGVRLRRDPDTTVGVDVVYISPAVMADVSDESTLIIGVPLLVVEILSPNDTLEEMHEKIEVYLRAGVALVWIIDPYDRTVRIYRPGEAPTFANERQDLSAEPHLPGFRVAAARLFN